MQALFQLITQGIPFLTKNRSPNTNKQTNTTLSLRKKCPYSELFWSTFSRITIILVLRVASWNNFIFYQRGKKCVFFLIFTMKLSFATQSCFNAHSTLNFAGTVKTFILLSINTNQTSKEQDMNFIRSGHLFWEQP